MLTPADLRRLTAAGPGPRIEVLGPGAASAERIARSLVALANAQGGVVIVPLKSTRGGKPVSGDDVMAQAEVGPLHQGAGLLLRGEEGGLDVTASLMPSDGPAFVGNGTIDRDLRRQGRLQNMAKGAFFLFIVVAMVWGVKYAK